ncbi:MAG: hypothetical protein CVT80_17120, partial [Alphaproteobacteria bacterium HGW-Alphaproteobacteria-2]
MKRGLAIVVVVSAVAIGYVVFFMRGADAPAPEAANQAAPPATNEYAAPSATEEAAREAREALDAAAKAAQEEAEAARREIEEGARALREEADAAADRLGDAARGLLGTPEPVSLESLDALQAPSAEDLAALIERAEIAPERRAALLA